MRQMTLKNIADAVCGTIYNELSDDGGEIQGITIDSRKVSGGYMFVATKGERVDGHDFVMQAFEKGAKYVLVEKMMPDIKEHAYIVVDSTFQAIKDLAEYYRKVLDITVIGITGSVGKTSTKEFIASVLSEKYNVLKTEGNFNNEVGLPLTIFNIREEHQVAVVEMGISDFGEMTRLSKIAGPDICVITNIGWCHLENLGDRDGVLRAKTEIFKYAAPDYKVILNGDDDKLITLREKNFHKKYYFSINSDSLSDGFDAIAKEIQMLGIEGSRCIIETVNGSFSVNIAIPGKHMIYNAMAATLTGLALGLSIDEIKNGIEKIQNVGGRLNVIKNDTLTIIDDCYNANPVSARSSLDVLDYADGRKVAILGDMFELGASENALHYELGKYINEKNIQSVVCIGSLSRNTYNGLVENGYSGIAYHFNNIDEFLENKDKILLKNDTVLVKASHSMHFEKIVKGIN